MPTTNPEGKGTRDETWQATKAQKYQKTKETTAYLKRDHQVVEQWE